MSSASRTALIASSDPVLRTKLNDALEDEGVFVVDANTNLALVMLMDAHDRAFAPREIGLVIIDARRDFLGTDALFWLCEQPQHPPVVVLVDPDDRETHAEAEHLEVSALYAVPEDVDVDVAGIVDDLSALCAAEARWTVPGSPPLIARRDSGR
jgi:AmiR/NasT family two-component response regulator